MSFLALLGLVRREMRGWVVTDEGDRSTVKLDIRDLGGHLDAAFRVGRLPLLLVFGLLLLGWLLFLH